MQLETEFKEPKSQYFNLACLILSLPTLIIFKVLGSCPVRVVTHPLNLPYDMTMKNRISFCLFYFIFINIFLGSCLVTQPLCHHHRNVDMAAMMALKKNPTRWLQGPKCQYLNLLVLFYLTNSSCLVTEPLNHFATTMTLTKDQIYSLLYSCLFYFIFNTLVRQTLTNRKFQRVQSYSESIMVKK